jgi:hypothetical protein
VRIAEAGCHPASALHLHHQHHYRLCDFTALDRPYLLQRSPLLNCGSPRVPGNVNAQCSPRSSIEDTSHTHSRLGRAMIQNHGVTRVHDLLHQLQTSNWLLSMLFRERCGVKKLSLTINVGLGLVQPSPACCGARKPPLLPPLLDLETICRKSRGCEYSRGWISIGGPGILMIGIWYSMPHSSVPTPFCASKSSTSVAKSTGKLLVNICCKVA